MSARAEDISSRHVVFVVNGLARAGAELMLLRLIKAISARQYRCTLVVLSGSGELAARMVGNGIRVIPLGLDGWRSLPAVAVRLYRCLRLAQPDVIQTWMYHADLLGAVVARLAGLRCVVWGVRNGDLALSRLSVLTRVVIAVCARLSSSLPHRIVYCAHSSRASHEARGYRADRGVVIPNALPDAAPAGNAVLQECPRKFLGAVDGEPLIGYVARYGLVKNTMGFLDMACLLIEARPDIRFVMVGQGHSATNHELVKEVQARGLSESVALVGEQADVSPYYQAFDVLVQTSWAEAFPNVLLEAMAHGTLCVATDVGDSAYLLGAAGMMIPAWDPKAAAQAVLELLSLPPHAREAMREFGRNRVSTQFNVNTLASRYLDAWGLEQSAASPCAA